MKKEDDIWYEAKEKLPEEDKNNEGFSVPVIAELMGNKHSVIYYNFKEETWHGVLTNNGKYLKSEVIRWRNIPK